MMNFVVRLLIVEDDETEKKSWKQVIELHNSEPEKHGFEIKDDYAKSLAEAEGLIASKDFDAAVVDIRLEQAHMNGPNGDGNDVVEKLLDSELAVVAVFTGETVQVAIPSWATQLVKTFRKGADDGEGTPVVMEWLRQQAPMIQSIRQAQQTIKKEMVRLFTHSIWPRWSHWMKKDDADDHLESALSRHLASHVHAALLEEAKQKVHPEEWYFIPPIRNGIRTGDIIQRRTGKLQIVITPRCDLAVGGKVDKIQLAECKIVAEEWDKRANKLAKSKQDLSSNTDGEKTKKLTEDVTKAETSLRSYTQHAGNKTSVHFLPAMRLPDGSSLGPFLVQFDKILSIPNIEAKTKALQEMRIASLTPEFLPSLIERLGGFFSRIGTPDYSHSS